MVLNFPINTQKMNERQYLLYLQQRHFFFQLNQCPPLVIGNSLPIGLKLDIDDLLHSWEMMIRNESIPMDTCAVLQEAETHQKISFLTQETISKATSGQKRKITWDISQAKQYMPQTSNKKRQKIATIQNKDGKICHMICHTFHQE